MDLRHVSHLAAEALNRAGALLLGDDAGRIDARVSSVGESSAVVLLEVDCREYELTLRERKRRPDSPEHFDTAGEGERE
jgi:hypothetical protein